ncbi:MAG: hypothetical protein JOY54_07160 [Acidobacteriaceae bacterium]|nr:hypothetical protein [Acidobacteriaceae bacterium]
MTTRLRWRPLFFACLVTGTACLIAGTLTFVCYRNLFNARVFSERVARSLSDPEVAAYLGDEIATAVINQRPDLVAIRPLIVATASSLVPTRPFVALAENAAQRAHQLALSEAGQRVALSVPDFQILIQSALSQANPEIAAKIPKGLALVGEDKAAQQLIQVARLGRRMAWVWKLLFPCSVLLFVAAVWLAQNRREALIHVGGSLTVAGLILGSLVPTAWLAAGTISEALERGAVRGSLHAFFDDFGNWGLFYIGLGVLFTAGAASLLERIDPVSEVRRYSRYLITPPAAPVRRFFWALVMVLCAVVAIVYPAAALDAVMVVIGIFGAYIGIRELFRLFLEKLAPQRAEETAWRGTQARAAFVAAGVIIALLAIGWFFWRNPSVQRIKPETFACNGYEQLCDKHLDQVVFAGTHNSMASQDIAGWMFPQQEANMPHQLRDGIHALLFDVHYGFPGGVRIKTDTNTEPMMDKVRAAIGDEAFEAALRIRNRLVGVDERHRELYLCHGLCELGAYELEPTLRQIRDFLVSSPDEVLIFIIEDYVDPKEQAAAFERAGLADFVYKGSDTPWPTLRELIESGQRVVTFIESGRPGVTWLRPAFQNFRETPYTFHTPEEFSCRPNRGDDGGSLFLINNWVETTPTPKPSNAAIVNAYSFLCKRAETCEHDRHHLPNIIAVDFYRTGDLLKVVNKLNGVEEVPGG